MYAYVCVCICIYTYTYAYTYIEVFLCDFNKFYWYYIHIKLFLHVFWEFFKSPEMKRWEKNEKKKIESFSGVIILSHLLFAFIEGV